MHIKTLLRNSLCSALIFVQIAAFPALTIAQEAVTESTPTTTSSTDSVPTSGSSDLEAPLASGTAESSVTASAPATQTQQAATTTGPTSPTGADANKYTENSDGTWSNDVYTWDPKTNQTSPNTPQEYSYNPSTGMWDTTEYIYSPEQGKYIPNIRSVTINPLAAADSQVRTQSSLTNPLIAGAAGSFTIGDTGPSSVNSINLGADTIGTFDLFFNGAISSNLTSNAQSGNALVQGNTKAGDALSGDASTIANLLNMLQSSWLGSSEIASFISTIDGNVFGDLLIDPNRLAYGVGSNNNNIDVNLSNNGAIDNNIDLVARSGDATVDSNTQAGNATTGDALAMANVINMINSAINAGKSFLGMINITGNLDGDILLPPGVLEALISNTGYNSTNTIGGGTNSNLAIGSNTTRTINNNIGTNAVSGNALVDSNTQAGNATTGDASTSINTMNMAGQNIAGKNGLLVFVNVLGRWVGMVVGPSPTTATITNTGPASTNNIGPGNSNQSLTVDANENSLINNDINITAQSGNATVSNNTKAGNATSGNSESAVNLLNLIDTNVNVTDWFGVLFINVFGNWFGNFGNDTANGGFSQSPATGGQGGGGQAAGTGPINSNVVALSGNPIGQVFNFIARNTGGNSQINTAANQTATTNGETKNNAVVFGSTTPSEPTTGTPSAATVNAPGMNWWLITGIIGAIVTVIVLIREYILALREERIISSVK